MKLLGVVLILFAFHLSINAQDFTSVQDGDWDDTDTWGTTGITDEVPVFGDEILIDGHDITVTPGAQGGAVTVTGDGSIILDNTLFILGLTMSGTSSITGSGILSSGGSLDIPSGTVTISDGQVNAVGINVFSGTLSVGAASLNITGNTVISGTLTFTSTTGTKEFRDITINSGGVWNNTSTESFTTRAITNNGTWNGCSNTTDCNYTISGSRLISGSNEISIPILTADATVTNRGVLEITNQLTGTGTFQNGNGLVNGITLGTLELNGAGTYDITNVDFSSFANTVSYTNSGSVTARATTYQTLVINKSANEVNLGGETRVSGTLTLTDGNLVLGSHNLVVSEGASLSVGSTDSYIQDSGTGVVRYEVSAPGADLYVPIGGAVFSPISINFSSASFGGSSSVDFSITDAAHPNRDRDNTGDSPAGDDNGTAATDYLDVYWTISGNNITNPVYSAEYTYDNSDFTQTTESLLVPALYRELSGGSTLDWLARGFVNATNNTASLSRGDGFGDLYAMDNTLERLPVQLVSFTARSLANSVMLQWETTTEENNSHFSVQRSTDGINFTDMALIEGQGTTSNIHNYQFADRFPASGRSYYRLKQVDFNGQFEYSEVVSVVYENTMPELSAVVYPNPVLSNEMVSFNITGFDSDLAFKVNIVDQQGQSVWLKEIEPSDKGPFQIKKALSPGLYLVHFIFNEGKSLSKKLIVR